MKPTSRKVLNTANFISGNLTGDFGKNNTIASIKGSVRKLGLIYQDALLVIFDKEKLLPIAKKKPNTNGDYVFHGLNTNLKTFIVAFDEKKQFNAVIQDNVVPK